MEIKKKIIPFIFGLSMAAALPLTAHADPATPEQDSGNVTYNGFATVSTEESGNTPVLTAIPECIMTIPKDTTIRKGSLSANIGRVTIDGKYFVKPYYVEVSADKADFVKTNNGTRIADPLAKQDIIFDVATATGAPSTDTEHSAADEATFVKSGTINLDTDTKKSTYTKTRAARRFWKDETLQSGQDTNYLAGEIVPINGQNDIFVNINTTQWTGDTSTEALKADTKPEGGKYSGYITFSAEFKDDFDSTWTSEWRDLT